MLKRLFGRRELGVVPVAASRESLIEAARARMADGRLAEAEIHLDALLEQFPGDAEIRNDFGRLRYAQGDFQSAEKAFARACDLAPGWPDARANLGQSLQVRGRYAEAARQFEAALAGEPRHHESRFNLALCLALLGSTDESLKITRGLVEEAPDDPTCHVLLAETLLRTGSFQDGWREYTWRTRVEEYRLLFRQYPQAEWHGENVPGSTVLIWPEQGYGDMLQFVRLLLVAARRCPAMSFVLEAEPALVRLMQVTCTACPNVRVVATGSPAPAFDRHASIMSLPGILDASLAISPIATPYLVAPITEVERWEGRVRDAAGTNLAVGLVWAGNRRERHGAADQAVDVRRSVGAKAMSALGDVAGCTFFNLQVGGRAGEMAALGVSLVDFTPELADFASSAALVSCLDLVISVDTAVVHLAGGLARPVWMLSRFDCCWRWGQRARQSAWYPTLRAFYQPSPGEWAPVIADTRAALVQAAAAHAETVRA